MNVTGQADRPTAAEMIPGAVALTSPGSWWGVPLLLLAAGGLCLMIDLPLAGWIKSENSPRLFAEALENCEPWGHGVGAGLAILGVWVLDPARRALVPWLAAASLGAGLISNCGKLIVSRVRPRDLDFHGQPVWDTFTAWLPILTFERGGQSFPSSHTTVAMGLSCFLAAMYPQGRWFFVLLTALVGLQRIQCSAHFPSDVCGGAALGWLVAQACITGAGMQRGKRDQNAA